MKFYVFEVIYFLLVLEWNMCFTLNMDSDIRDSDVCGGFIGPY
jgi:hypothetical protein